MYEIYNDAPWPDRLSNVLGPISWRLSGAESDSGGTWRKPTVEHAQLTAQALTDSYIANAHPLLARLGSERAILESLRQGRAIPADGAYGIERLRASLEALHGDSKMALALINDVLTDAAASSTSQHLVPWLTRVQTRLVAVSARRQAPQ